MLISKNISTKLSFETILRSTNLLPKTYISNPHTLALIKEHHLSEQCAKLYHLKLMASAIIKEHNSLNENHYIDFLTHEQILMVVDACGMDLRIKNRKIHNDTDKIDCLIDWIEHTSDIRIWDYNKKTKLFYIKNDDGIFSRGLVYVEHKVDSSRVEYGKLLHIKELHKSITDLRFKKDVHIPKLEKAIQLYKKAVGESYKRCIRNLTWSIKLNNIERTMKMISNIKLDAPKSHKRNHEIKHLQQGTETFKRYQLLVLIDHLNLTLSTDNSNLLVGISRYKLEEYTGLSSGTIANLLSRANFTKIGSYEEIMNSTDQDIIIKERIKANNSSSTTGHHTIGKRLVEGKHVYYLIRILPNVYRSTDASIVGLINSRSNEVTRVTENDTNKENNTNLVDNNVDRNFKRVIQEAYTNIENLGYSLCMVANSKRFLNVNAMAHQTA